MANIRERFEGLPDDWVKLLEEWQEKLPESQRARAAQLLDRLPVLPKSLRTLFDKVYDQAKATFDDNPREIAIVGPVNSGKSTLVNALTGKEVAKVSPIPGTTQETQWVSVGPFKVADTPGMEEAGGEDRTRKAIEAAKEADLILLLFDAGTGITESYRSIYHQVMALGKPTVVALNKIDLVKAFEGDAVESAERILRTEVLAISCKTGYHLGELMKALALLDPRVLNIIGDLLPRYQKEVARQRVATAAALAGAIGWEPIPIADVIPLTAIQSMMVLEIGKLYGYKMSLDRAKELMATFAGGIVLREGFRQITKLIPFGGSVISGAYAAAGTAALGAAAIAWFESGGQLQEGEARRIYGEAMKKFRTGLMPHLTRNRGQRERVEEGVEEALQSLPEPETAPSLPPANE
ncbi:MAG: 50S ribosome-binding GTPase [Armatimonadetes bacterium]|nr:50S ribosome-binding GTPase [Armatimonadota bacterium]